MTPIRRILTVAAAIAVLLAAALAAKTYVSLLGNFYISYPDTWEQIDYTTADMFLYQGVPPEQQTDYEAVFAPSDVTPWSADAYLVLTVDTISHMSQWHIDSILLSTTDVLGKRMQGRSRANLFSDLTPGQLYYDAETRTSAVQTARVTDRPEEKTAIFAQRFFDHGVATFYFYTPDSSYQRNVATISDIVASLSTENVEAAMPRETLKVAEAGKLKQQGGSSRPSVWILAAGLLLILMALAIFAVRRRKLAQK